MKKTPLKNRLFGLAALGVAAGLREVVMRSQVAKVVSGGGPSMAGLGDDIDTSSPEYAAWYYNTYVPWYQAQQAARYAAQQYQPGYQYQQQGYQQPYQYGYQSYTQQPGAYDEAAQNACMIQGGRWQDTGHGFACSVGGASFANPTQLYAGNPQACAGQGGYWDAFSNQCVSRVGVANQPAAVNPPNVIGTPAQQAMNALTAQGWTPRVTRNGYQRYATTYDYNPRRVNLEIDNGYVSNARVG